MINVQCGESLPANVKQIKAFSTKAEAPLFPRPDSLVLRLPPPVTEKLQAKFLPAVYYLLFKIKQKPNHNGFICLGFLNLTCTFLLKVPHKFP